MIWLLSFGLTLFYWFLSQHIDFHPDEAIYFDAIPFSIRNDAGVFYSAFNLLLTHWITGPDGARLASTILGGATFLVMARTVALVQPLSLSRIAVLFTAFSVSYQGIFVFIRVRPEAAWWFCAVLVLYAAIWFETRCRDKVESGPLAALMLAVVLLPMNHRLSWFACAFAGGYAVLFLWREKGLRVAGVVCFSLLAGVILNVILRAWWTGVPLYEAFSVAMSSPGGQRQPVKEFLKLVFQGAPLFLNDTAQNANLYEWITGSKARILSHAFVQNALWLLMFVLPLVGKTWKERYVFAFPSFALFAFWISGYYNPTYSAGFSLFCIIALAYSLPGLVTWWKKIAWLVLAISVVNGLSFIVTRVLHHGDASYFAAEKEIRQVAVGLGPEQKLAVPERFMPAYSGLPVQHYVNFKSDIPADVDVLVTDSYDLLMYGFVPDFEAKKQALIEQTKRMCLTRRVVTPVYEGDDLFGGSLEQTQDKAGSWFFRNSAAYTLSIYRKCDLQDDKQ
jgi:hypothetical protein